MNQCRNSKTFSQDTYFLFTFLWKKDLLFHLPFLPSGWRELLKEKKKVFLFVLLSKIIKYQYVYLSSKNTYMNYYLNQPFKSLNLVTLLLI